MIKALNMGRDIIIEKEEIQDILMRDKEGLIL
jgi:hypothetical protein